VLRRAARPPKRRPVDHGAVEQQSIVLSSRPHPRARLGALLAATGLLIGGCGGSSSPLSGSFHAPAGYVPYHGSGYVVAIPTDFVAKPGTVPEQPPGSTVTEATHGGSAAARAQAEILLLENPHLTFTIDQVVSNLERADRTNTQVSNVQIGVTKATVPGSRAARIVSERYVAPDSPSNRTPTQFDRKWLMVLIRPGLLLDVVVANAPNLGGRIDANAVIDSFRLER
jgi:hypothetical protein